MDGSGFLCLAQGRKVRGRFAGVEREDLSFVAFSQSSSEFMRNRHKYGCTWWRPDSNERTRQWKQHQESHYQQAHLGKPRQHRQQNSRRWPSHDNRKKSARHPHGVNEQNSGDRTVVTLWSCLLDGSYFDTATTSPEESFDAFNRSAFNTMRRALRGISPKSSSQHSTLKDLTDMVAILGKPISCLEWGSYYIRLSPEGNLHFGQDSETRWCFTSAQWQVWTPCSFRSYRSDK